MTGFLNMICPFVHLFNIFLPALIVMTFPLNAWIDAKYGKKFNKEYRSRYVAFLIVSFFEIVIYLLGYSSGFLMGVCV